MRATLYFRFDDEAEAIKALADYRTDEGWNTAYVDADVPIIDRDGNPVKGYFVNLLCNERFEALEQLTGWVGTHDINTRKLISGERPRTPQRAFA